MMSAARVGVLGLMLGCGLKAPPRPPLKATAGAPTPAAPAQSKPDAGAATDAP
jgi:hypothetical protein